MFLTIKLLNLEPRSFTEYHSATQLVEPRPLTVEPETRTEDVQALQENLQVDINSHANVPYFS